MKTTNVIQEATANEGISEEALEMSIDVDSSVFLMDALGKLYSQPARAALREYLANGIDAHVEAGGKRPPIEIKLASADDRMLSIRDFGNGMSEDDFNKILRRYGASTKRHSNKLTGGFGLGAKAGFALTDSFHMTSFQNGMKIKVRIFKNSEGKGFIEVIDRASTTEADGLLVEVEIPRLNIEELSYKSLVDDRFFAAYRDSEIKVIAAEKVTANRWSGNYSIEMRPLPIEENSLWNSAQFDPLEYGGEIVGWVGKTSARTAPTRAIIGRVNYSIKHDSNGSGSSGYSYSNRTSYSDKFGAAMQELNKFDREIILNLPIGSVDLPSSREEITYSERSLKTIVAVASSIHRVVEEQVQRKINSHESGFDALCEIISLHSDDFWKANSLTWRNRDVPFEAGKKSFREKGDIVRYLKTNEARKSLTIDTVTSRSISEIPSWKNPARKTLTIIAKDMEEYSLAIKKVKSNINDYHKSQTVQKNVQVFLFAPNEPLTVWFEQGEKLTLDEFINIAKAYRSAKRADAKALATARGGNSNLAPAKVTAANREVFHIELNRALTGGSVFLPAETENTLLANATDFYYLSRAEVKEVSNELSNLFPTKQSSGSAVIDASYIKLLPALKNILGEDKKVVFVPATRNMDDFKALYPNVPSIVPALKSALQVEWNHIISGNKVKSYFCEIFWLVPNRGKVSLINQFFKELTPGEAVSMNKDLIEINEYMDINSRTASSRLNILISELLGRNFTQSVTSWMEKKVDIVGSRYPLLTMMNPYNQHWDVIKPEMIRYLKTC